MNSQRPRARLALSGMLLAVLAPVAALASACAESVTESGNCDEGLTQCGDECVDTETSPADCGACGHDCPEGAACEAGACVAECSDLTINCDGSCVDLGTDSHHCGACGLLCPPGAVCSGGVCNAPCPDGLLACGGGCVDGQTDVANCGACDVECAPGEACVEGVCGACPDGQTKCGTQCVDVQTNPQHCGGCGLSCAQGFSCEAGMCTNPCGAGEIPCGGQCVDTQSNPQHCGACNNYCAMGQECQGGSCVCTGGACGVCSLTDLGSTIPQSVNGSTWNAPDLYYPGCGSSGAGEVAYSFTAPADGSYYFNTSGSGFDTVLAVLSPGCSEVACNDNVGFDWYSKVTVPMTQGETVYVVVDGMFDMGSYTLNVGEAAPPICPVADLGSTVPQTITGSTLGAGDALTMSCNFNGQPSADQSYTFTAPADGAYVFDTFGSSMNTVLHVLDGGCAGMEMICNDDWNGWESKVIVNLTQGQTVVVGVEGSFGEEGDFMLNVSLAPPPVCPGPDLGSTVPQSVTGSTMNQGDALPASCNAPFQSADVNYIFTAPADGSYSFDTLGSPSDTVIHLHQGGCAGPEIACNNDYGGGWESFTYATLTAGEIVVVSVEGAYGDPADFVLNVNSYSPPPCPMQDLGSAVPQTVNGNTNGLADFLTGSCSGPGSPEMTYSFTAPAAGTYTFDTFGTNFDTVLHLHAGTCAGAELDCNDDDPNGMGVQSEVSAALQAGQTVVVAVDGYGGNSGPFTLHVHQ